MSRIKSGCGELGILGSLLVHYLTVHDRIIYLDVLDSFSINLQRILPEYNEVRKLPHLNRTLDGLLKPTVSGIYREDLNSIHNCDSLLRRYRVAAPRLPCDACQY